MKFFIFLLVLVHVSFFGNSQIIEVEFKSQFSSNLLDSIIVQNMRTSEIINIEPNNILKLNLPTNISNLHAETPYIFYKQTLQGMEIFTNYNGTQELCVRVIDATGKIIINKETLHFQGEPILVIPNLGNGVYFIQAYTKDKALHYSNVFTYNESTSYSSIHTSSSLLKRVDNLFEMAYQFGDILQCIGYSEDLTNSISISPFQDTCIYFSFMGTVTDIENNVYNTIQIGNQTWFAENLNTSTYSDGNPIINITDNTEWTTTNNGAYCNVNNELDSSALYGKLYNWFAVETEILCPLGWHVPTNEEWIELRTYLIENGFNYDSTTTENKIAKSLAQINVWPNSLTEGSVGFEQNTNNATGFSALPTGNRTSSNGAFNYNYTAYWWSSSTSSNNEIYRWSISDQSIAFFSTDYPKNMGYSVRCIKN